MDKLETAFLAAHYRGVESKRPDALFRDPFAEYLAGKEGARLAGEFSPFVQDMTAKVIAVRTRIIDQYIEHAIENGVDAIINLGAGLDTRPWRMQLPESLIWYETDYPEMIRYKTLRVARQRPKCRVQVLGLDLENQRELRSVLQLMPGNKTFLALTEGIISYLETKDVAFLARSLRDLPVVRYWIVDYLSKDVTPIRPIPYKFRPEDWHEFFEKHGWVPDQIHYLPEEAEKMGRPLGIETQNERLVGFAMLKRSNT